MNLNTSTNLHLVSLQGRLSNDLKILFGQSPAIADAIAKKANDIYLSENNLNVPGTFLYSAINISEPSGKPLNLCTRVSVTLTTWKDSDDLITDMKTRRKTIFSRIVQEAYDQDGLLTIEDCERILLTSQRTLKEYKSELNSEGVFLPLRGFVHNTGRGQTHKNEIISFYLEGMTFEDIKYRTYHSFEAISRYISKFQKIVICYIKQNMNFEDISRVVGVNINLIKDYIKIYEKYSSEDNERINLILNPLESNNFFSLIKKKKVKL
jgi:hypothetical protein